MSSAFPSRILGQLAEGAPFQLYLRSMAVDSARYNLETLGYLDDRIDGLLTGILQLTSEELARQSKSINTETPGGMSVLAYYAANNDIRKVMDLAAVAANDERLRAEFLAGMQWLEVEVARPAAETLFRSSDPSVSQLGLAPFELHNLPPGEGLAAALAQPHAGLRAAAARCVGEFNVSSLFGALFEHLADDDERVRFACAAALARSQTTQRVVATLQKVVEDAGPLAGDAAFITGMVMPDANWPKWWAMLAASPQHLTFALRALIGRGDVAKVDWLIAMMKNEELAGAAGEVFSALTNSNQASEPKIAAWWERNRERFLPLERWFLGEPVSLKGLHHALLKGNQKQRVWAAKLLFHVCPDKPSFPATAPAFRQVRLLHSEY